jgi:hypothetical protein
MVAYPEQRTGWSFQATINITIFSVTRFSRVDSLRIKNSLAGCKFAGHGHLLASLTAAILNNAIKPA